MEKILCKQASGRAGARRLHPGRGAGGTGVTTDSREVRPGCLCSRSREKFDGHDFAAKALENGAVYVVVNHPVEGVPAEKAILCPDRYHAMMVMARTTAASITPRWW